MSSVAPITIPRYSHSSGPSSSTSGPSSQMSTPPSSAGLYVPLHKRSGSSSKASSSRSRSSSPSRAASTSRRYSAEYLLSLRPNADESVKQRVKESCPEVAMNRKTRKTLEFNEHQRMKAMKEAAASASASHSIPSPIAHTTLTPVVATHTQNHAHTPTPSTPSVPAPAPALTFTRPTLASQPSQRVLPRRNRQPAVRPADRRRQALQSLSASATTESWRLRVPVQPLAFVSSN